MSTHSHVILTGLPGVGKTTAIQKACDIMQKTRKSNVKGFYTEEVRKNGKRIGFDVVTVGGECIERSPLARILEQHQQPRVGQYTVMLKDFERSVLPILDSAKAGDAIVIDEIGKMELLSHQFSAAVNNLFARDDIQIICTVPLKWSNPLLDKLKNRSDKILLEVTKENRNSIPDKIMSACDK